jgi:hypothetical protein
LTWAREQLPLSGANLIFLTPSPEQVPHSSLVRMFDAFGRFGGAERAAFLGTTETDGAWSVHVPQTTALLEACAVSRRPVAILGTAFNFVHLLDSVLERIPLPAGSWVLETGGYKGRSRSMTRGELHGCICESFGIDGDRVVSEYGMCELSSQAYDTSLLKPSSAHGNRVFRFPPWARAFVVSPETGREVAEGEIGLLRVCDLANVYSVMAIETQDLARKCGDGFELLGRAVAAEPRGCSLTGI